MVTWSPSLKLTGQSIPLTELMSNSFSKSHQFVLWSFTTDGGNQLRGILFPGLSANDRRLDILWLFRVSERHFPIFCPIFPCYCGQEMSRCIKCGINHCLLFPLCYKMIKYQEKMVWVKKKDKNLELILFFSGYCRRE